MATAITVIYPDTDDATFNLDYYLAKHMPMVAERFGPYGLKGYRVARFIGTPQGGKSPYSMIVTLEFDTPDQFRTAIAAEAEAIIGDVPNFSNKEAIIMIGEVLAVR